MVSLRMISETRGMLQSADGTPVQYFIIRDGVVRLDGPRRIGNDESMILGAIDELRHRAVEEDFAGIEDDEIVEKVVNSEDETDPFNPEDISIDTKLVTMETLLRRLEQNAIQLNPDFQRQEVWDNVRKSQLIESLMLKIPIPMFYVSSDEKGNWSVVDGLQRISTFRDFILGPKFMKNSSRFQSEKGNGMALTGLEFWKSLNGCTMNELPRHLYNRILESVFTFTIVNPGTHEEVKRNIFKRLNTGGMPLSPQEIRNALYTGPSTILLNELAQTKEFKEATCYSIHAQRMEDCELILRFIAFMLRKPTTYKRTQNIDTWLSDSMIILNAMPNLDTREFNKCVHQKTIILSDIENINFDQIKELFLLAMRRAKKLFGKHAFRKSTPDMRRRPINKSLFEIWSVLLCEMSEEQFNALHKNRTKLVPDYRSILDDYNFEIAISRDSMRHTSVALRYDRLKELVNKYTVE
ncbi:MAG: DUF262 domain-containing protein [Bacteroidaceae bacterium]|nr:DUF262 domain-containing protein [Bacteroidaceae bacterium]